MTKKSFMIAAIVAAATIGSGVFAIPYVIQTSGWAIALGYFLALILVVSVVHSFYLRTLAATNEKERLLGLAQKYFGSVGFWIGFLAIVIGLLLGFVAYLVLGTQFLTILIPGISQGFALGLFWFLLACLIWGSEGRIAWLEVTGIALISCAIAFIFVSGHPVVAFANMPVAVPENLFFPFGAVLFAIAGWTSVEQVYEFARPKKNIFWVLATGSALAGLLYWFFALGVIGAGGHVAMDTISGIGTWPTWRKDILAVIGLLALAVVSLPLSREIRGAIEKDLRWNSVASRAAIIFLPLIAIFAGLHNFLTIISLTGGVFISTQYLLIVSVSRRTLSLSVREKVLMDILSAIFVCAAIYSIYIFIVR